MQPKLTIGMAVYEDFDGVCFTLQHLRAFHSIFFDLELIVVDNNPASQHGKTTKAFCEKVGARYIEYPQNTGTSQTRNLVFKEAQGEYVICMDSHVFFLPGAIDALMAYYNENPNTKDLIQGPLVYDNYESISTHFSDEWRSEMWGTWGTDSKVWKNKPIQRSIWWNGKIKPFTFCTESVADEPFEIFAQGLGVFSCRRDAWLGFNENFRGFGGEECYIHEKYRQAGHKTLCLPKFLWWHRFARPNGVPYPVTSWNKVRNYVLGHLELNLPLDNIYKHFVQGINTDGTPARGLDKQGKPLPGSIPLNEWEELIADPLATLPASITKRQDAHQIAFANGERQGCTTCNGKIDKLEDMYNSACKTPSDINEHVAKLKELADECEHVTDFSMRHSESTVGLLMGKPKKLVTVYPTKNQALLRLSNVASSLEGVQFQYVEGDSLGVEIEETDLLFLDTIHTADHLLKELNKHAAKVRRWIVVHDTQIYGEVGENGRKGVLAGLRDFMRDNPRWSVYYHASHNNGLTVLSCDERDKKKLPGKIQMGMNYAKAVKDHIVSGAQQTPKELYEKRLEVCWVCEQRNNERCGACGCPILEKAAWKEQACPLGKWQHLVQLEGAKK